MERRRGEAATAETEAALPVHHLLGRAAAGRTGAGERAREDRHPTSEPAARRNAEAPGDLLVQGQGVRVHRSGDAETGPHGRPDSQHATATAQTPTDRVHPPRLHSRIFRAHRGHATRSGPGEGTPEPNGPQDLLQEPTGDQREPGEPLRTAGLLRRAGDRKRAGRSGQPVRLQRSRQPLQLVLGLRELRLFR